MIRDSFHANVEFYKRGLFDFIEFYDDTQESTFKFHTKQVDALELMNDNITTYVGYGGAARGGKEQPYSELVCTPWGFKAMGSLNVGDKVIGKSGGHVSVLQIHEQGVKDVYEVKFSDGSACRCGIDHLWSIKKARCKTKMNKRNGSNFEVMTTSQIIQYLEDGYYNLQIPLCDPVRFTPPPNKNKTILSPYIIGALIGDGGLTNATPRLFSEDDEIIQRVKEELPDGIELRHKGDITYSIVDKDNKKNRVTEELKRLGLMHTGSETKFIPDYMQSISLKGRISLCNGLMDTDGTISKEGGVSYCTVSKQLAKDVQQLLFSLGCKATIHIRDNKYYRDKEGNKVFGKRCYIVIAKSNNDSILFHLSRKKNRATTYIKEGVDLCRRMVSVNKVGSENSRCIVVNAPDRLYLTRDYIVTHNTALETLCPLFECFVYPGARYLIGRKDLGILHRTTWKTLVKFMKVFNIVEDVDYKYNRQKHELIFNNGSEIILQNLELKPSDPEATSFGSLELTKAFIDQSEQVDIKIIEKVGERVGSHMGHIYGIKGKVMEAFNPSNTHVKTRYWIPFRNKEEKKTRRFVRALPTDNPSPEAMKWVDQKEFDHKDGTMSNVEYQKQILGNFDFDDDPFSLVSYQAIEDIFTNAFLERGEKYIVADVAGEGGDDYIITYWEGDVLDDYMIIASNDGKQARMYLDKMKREKQVPNRNICYDAVGMGFALSGYFKGAYQFRSGDSAIDDDYYRLRDQCAFHLARKIDEDKVGVECDMPDDLIDLIKVELGQLKEYDDNNDKRRLLPKKIIKKNIGHSPNWMDVFIMKQIFDINKKIRLFAGMASSVKLKQY